MNLLRAPFALTLLAALSGPADARDWPEPGGGPLNRGATTAFRAPQMSPVERWRATYDQLLSEPVVADGVVYIATRRKGTCRLVTLDAATGAEVGAIKIVAPSFAHVSVQGGTIVIVTTSSLTIFRRQGTAIALSRAVPGSYRSAASLLPGVAAVATGQGVKVYDTRSGEVLAVTPSLPTKPIAIRGEEGAGEILCQAPLGPDETTGITRIVLSGLDTRTPKAVLEGTTELLVPYATTEQPPRLIDIDHVKGARLLVAGDHRVRTTGRGLASYFLAPTAAEGPVVQTDPCVWNGTIYGRNVMGGLIAQLPGEKHVLLVAKKQRPVGAVDGPITCASGVLLLGNYAFDTEAGRVLWVAPKMAVEGPLIPAGDELVVYNAGGGVLVAAGPPVAGQVIATGPAVKPAPVPGKAPATASQQRPRKSQARTTKEPARTTREPAGTTNVAVKEPATRTAAKASQGQAPDARQQVAQDRPQQGTQQNSRPSTRKAGQGSAPRPKTPGRAVARLAGSAGGVVLVDGRRIAGRVEVLDAGRVRLHRDGKKPAEFAPALLSAIETSEGLHVIGAPYGLVVATQASIGRTLARDLAKAVELYARRGFPAEARRLMRELRGRDLDAKRLDEIEELVTNAEVSELGNREMQLSAVTKMEKEARESALRSTITSAANLDGAKLRLEASALLSGASEIWPGAFTPEDVAQRISAAAQPLVAEDFPWAKERRGTERWLEWARELAPSRARFAHAGEIPDLGPKNSSWRRDTVVLRSRNLLVVSRSSDPQTVGRSISRGEATVRALATILGDAPRRDDRPLQVWIHRNRSEYMGEALDGATTADANSLGFYAPELRASRFHVPARAQASSAARGLGDVMASVLTHQYVAERWHILEKGETPGETTQGHWALAGLARFVEDQRNSMGQLRIRFDARDVPSLEASIVLAHKGELLELASFFDHSCAGVDELSRVPIVTVELGTPPVAVAYSTRSIFDDQAAALVFFLLHNAGKGAERTGGRRLFRQVLLGHCRSETGAAVWKELGFETSGELEEAFRAFLADLADSR